MAEQTKVTTLEKVVIRFSGDSGDGMQLTGTIFSNLSAILGMKSLHSPIIRQKCVLLKEHLVVYQVSRFIWGPVKFLLPVIRRMCWSQ